MEITDTIIKPRLMVRIPNDNLLRDLGYYSYEERLFDLAEMFKKNVNIKYSKTVGAMVYEKVADRYKGSQPRMNHLIFNDIYKLGPFESYMGNIPQKNQVEIKNRFNALLENPMLNQEFELVILAPLNNFAEDSNIKAIDPIVFAYFKEGENCYERNYLITLSQWL